MKIKLIKIEKNEERNDCYTYSSTYPGRSVGKFLLSFEQGFLGKFLNPPWTCHME